MTNPESERVQEIIRILRANYPDARVTLDYENPFQLLVATILAAQSTDKKVNEVTPELFRKYPTPEAFASADLAELEQDIRATGFYRQKARAIVEAAQDIVNFHEGRVPATMDELTKLRGVGRKTANVILGNVFGTPGIVVDTHMIRISGRLGLVEKRYVERKEADKIELELMQIVPEPDWTTFSHLIVALGRDICTAKNPRHGVCPILHLCPAGQAAVTA